MVGLGWAGCTMLKKFKRVAEVQTTYYLISRFELDEILKSNLVDPNTYTVPTPTGSCSCWITDTCRKWSLVPITHMRAYA